MSEINVNEQVHIRLIAGHDFASPGDDPGALHRALVNEVRGDKLVLGTSAHPNGFASSFAAGDKVLLQKSENGSVLIYQAIVTAVLNQGVSRVLVRTLGEAKQGPQRAFPRVSMGDTEIRYAQTGGQTWKSAKLRDLSESGACLIAHSQLRLGQGFTLELQLERQMVYAKGVVRRCSADKANHSYIIGIEFLDSEGQRDRIQKIVAQHQKAMPKK